VDQRLHLKRYLFNLPGGVLTLASLVMPWYLVWFCDSFVIVWLSEQYLPFLFVLAGGVSSFFSRYGALVTLDGSLISTLLFQEPSYTIFPPRGIGGMVACPPSTVPWIFSGFYNVLGL